MMDHQHLEELYDHFSNAVHAFALQLSHDPEVARDLLQTVFVRLARRPRFTIFNPRSFLLRCTYRAYVDFVRHESTLRRTLETLSEAPPSVFEPEPASPEQEQIFALLEQIAALPAEQRAVVHLKIWEERTFRQIAQILGISASTAASRFRYALDKLKVGIRLESNHGD